MHAEMSKKDVKQFSVVQLRIMKVPELCEACRNLHSFLEREACRNLHSFTGNRSIWEPISLGLVLPLTNF